MDQFTDTRQRPFRSLSLMFQAALGMETVSKWVKCGLVSRHHLPELLGKERSKIENHDFDSRMLELFDEAAPTLEKGQDKNWFKWNRKLTAILDEVRGLATGSRWRTPILIDKVDDDWDGADESVVRHRDGGVRTPSARMTG